MEKNTCEQCGERHPANKSTPTADGCYLCSACQEEWKTTVFDKCAHDCKPYEDDEQVYCDKCSGVTFKELTKKADHETH